MRQCYNRELLKEKALISKLFLNEINYCLTSSCDYLTFQCEKDEDGIYEISLRPSSDQHTQGCDECTVRMPTGTLHVNSEINIDEDTVYPNNCSLIFQWNSKVNRLSAPDKLLLQQPQPVSSLTIYVDFVPAQESLKPSTSGAGCEHDYLIVPKRCNVCEHVDYFNNKWRKSWCISELNAFTAEMSKKHIKCYQTMKFLSVTSAHPNLPKTLPNYHIKTIVLRHHSTCTDTTDDCVDCVLKMFHDLLQAYKTGVLLVYQSNL